MPETGYSRSKARDDEARAALTPLAPGERPLGLKLAAGLALLVALANVVGVIAGAGEASATAGLAFAGVMLLAAAGLWVHNLFAVIAFEVLLGIGIVYAMLSLLFASSLLGVLIAVTVVVVCSPIFWLLVRVMARLQVPEE